MNITELRLSLFDRGYIPLPITCPDAPGKDAGKAPRLLKWQTIEITPDAIRCWERTRRRETNTGLRCGYMLGLDIDVRDAALVNTLVALASDTICATPLMRIGQAPKALLAYRTEVPFTKIKTPRLLMPDGQPALIECLATGQQFVGFGIHPGTRQPYHWPHASPLDVPLSELPVVTDAQARAFVAEAESLLRAAGGRPEAKDEPAGATPRCRAPRPPSAWPAPTHQDVADALKAVPNHVDWHWWVKIGAALFDALADDGEDLFIRWSAQSPNDDPEYTRRKWRSFRASAMTTTAATLFWRARQNGWRPASEREDQRAHRKETARSAFQLLRRGAASTELLAVLHEQNCRRPDPLPAKAVDDTAIWAARQAMERAHAK
jgi:putative DNA primase/helicase